MLFAIRFRNTDENDDKLKDTQSSAIMGKLRRSSLFRKLSGVFAIHPEGRTPTAETEATLREFRPAPMMTAITNITLEAHDTIHMEEAHHSEEEEEKSSIGEDPRNKDTTPLTGGLRYPRNLSTEINSNPEGVNFERKKKKRSQTLPKTVIDIS